MTWCFNWSNEQPQQIKDQCSKLLATDSIVLNVYLQIKWVDGLRVTSTIRYSFNHNQIKTAQYIHMQ